MGEHSQRLGHLGESKVDVTLSQAGEEGEGREEQMQHPGGSKVQNEWVTEMVELYKVGQLGEGKPAPGLKKFRVGAGLCQSGEPCNK